MDLDFGSRIWRRKRNARQGANSSGWFPIGLPRRKVPTQAIYFFDKHEPYYSFTNNSDYSVWYEGRRYPTSEHLFQATKFFETRPNIAEHIRTSPRLSEALQVARTHEEHVRPSWYAQSTTRMNEALYLKFTQHDVLRLELLRTGDAELILNSPTDAFWGNGANNDGHNELGKALMRLRDKLREAEPPLSVPHLAVPGTSAESLTELEAAKVLVGMEAFMGPLQD